MRRIKILHILWSGKSGGAERFVRDITLHSDREGFEHHVLFLSKGGWIADSIAENGTNVSYIGMTNGFCFLSGLKMLNILRANSVDIVHIHCRNYLINLVLRFFSRVPSVYFEHGGNLIGEKPEREKLLYKVFGNSFNLILANSEYVRKRVLEVSNLSPARVKTIHIGIDPEPYRITVDKSTIRESLGIPLSNRVVGIVGRLVPEKGMDDFIKVCAHVDKLKEDERYTYVIVGDGPLRVHLENMARELNIEIKFLGDRKDVSSLLKIFDIFIFTSRWEAFGIVLLEAMAAGVPIVGFFIDGANEIAAGGGAILIEGRDYEKITHLVRALLNDETRRIQLGKEGTENIKKNFFIQNSIKELETDYLRLLN